MRILRQLVRIIKDARGAATSLVEAGLTIGVGAALAGAALTGGVDASKAAEIAVAKEQAGQIGQAVLSFYSDLKILPGWRSGNETGPNSTSTYTLLVSEQGSYPLRASTATGWGGVDGSHPAYAKSLYGEQVNLTDHDTIENQLDRDAIGFDPGDGSDAFSAANLTAFLALRGATIFDYPRRGTLPDATKGHSTNYLQSVNSVRYDPWSHKFLINVQNISAAHNKTAVAEGVHSVVVFVLSAGPDGVIDTPQVQPGDSVQALGDDVFAKIAVVKF